MIRSLLALRAKIRRPVFVSLLLLCAAPVRAQYGVATFTPPEDPVAAYTGYPAYRQALGELFRLAGEDRIPAREAWTLDKHPAGWRLRSLADPPATDPVLLWDRETGHYALSLPNAFTPVPPERRQAAYRAWLDGEAFYRMALFHGYPAADRHVLAALAGGGELPGPYLVALARAHAHEARRLLRPVLGEYDRPGLAPDSMTTDSLDRADAHFRAAVVTYARATSVDPTMRTLLGRVGLEVPSAAMTAWLHWQMAGFPARAEPFLEQAVYDDFLAATGHNLLASCPPDAVLLTYGDTETFLALAAQQRDGARPDVTVVSFPMLLLPRYRAWLAEGYPGAPLDGLPPANGGYYALLDEEAPAMAFAHWIDAWQAGADRLPVAFTDWLDGVDSLSLPMRWVEATDLLELALLDTVAGHRPVAYHLAFHTQRPYGSLYDHSHLFGLVHAFSWRPQRSDQQAALRRVVRSVVDEWRFPGVDRSLAEEPAAMAFVRQYRNLAAIAAMGLADAGDAETGLLLINVLWRHLPEWTVPPDADDGLTVAFHYEHGSPDRAAELAEAVYAAVADDPGQNGLLDELEALAREHGQDGLLERYAALRTAPAPQE